jgi:hypothetical protein
MLILFGILLGICITIPFFTTRPEIDYKLQYTVEKKLKINNQQYFKHLYIMGYCENKNVRDIIIQSYNESFMGLYCDKPLIILLDEYNSLPYMIIDTTASKEKNIWEN